MFRECQFHHSYAVNEQASFAFLKSRDGKDIWLYWLYSVTKISSQLEQKSGIIPLLDKISYVMHYVEHVLFSDNWIPMK